MMGVDLRRTPTHLALWPCSSNSQRYWPIGEATAAAAAALHSRRVFPLSAFHFRFCLFGFSRFRSLFRWRLALVPLLVVVVVVVALVSLMLLHQKTWEKTKRNSIHVPERRCSLRRVYSGPYFLPVVQVTSHLLLLGPSLCAQQQQTISPKTTELRKKKKKKKKHINRERDSVWLFASDIVLSRSSTHNNTLAGPAQHLPDTWFFRNNH